MVGGKLPTVSMLTEAASLSQSQLAARAGPRSRCLEHSPAIMVVAVNVEDLLSLHAENT